MWPLTLAALLIVDLAATCAFALPTPALVSKADPNQILATAGALMVPQVNQRAFSADGRYVAFQSSSENLIAGLTEADASVVLRHFLSMRSDGANFMGVGCCLC